VPRRDVAPHIYEAREEAEGHLRDLERDGGDQL
jgi:hypothetical protein